MEAVLETDPQRYGGTYYVWRPEDLKQDGGFPLDCRPSGTLIGTGFSPDIGVFGLYDEARERNASTIRQALDQLRKEIATFETALRKLYYDHDA